MKKNQKFNIIKITKNLTKRFNTMKTTKNHNSIYIKYNIPD